MKDKDMEKKINDFIIFCLESYKFKHGINGVDAHDIFSSFQFQLKQAFCY